MRTAYDQYPEYHTSLDNKDYISFSAMADSVEIYKNIVNAIDNNYFIKNLMPFGEPQLGKRGLYSTLSHKVALLSYQVGFSLCCMYPATSK